MAITSGCISIYKFKDEFQNVATIRSSLSNFQTSRSESRRRLNSAIQLNNTLGKLGGGINVLSGIIYDEYLKTTGRVVKINDNADDPPEFTIATEPYIDVRIGSFWILNNGVLISNKLANRNFISRLVGLALSTEIKPCQINIQRVSDDYRNNWVGGIVDREGNWQSGQVYGTDLRNDDCIGSEFVRCPKNQVGGLTEYFGSGPTKFKVSRDGSVLVLQSWENTRDPFIGFINQEISPYFVRPEFD